MSNVNVEIVLLALVSCLAIATARPQGFLDQFLSFKDGNVRVNFGGYHAEAGLGGLLSGGRTGGGLHASAGTPSGANAQAGLGGLLGENGFTGGSLGASAGLGRNAPQASAGLGGVLSGNGFTGGSLGARASLGQTSPQAAAGLGGALDGNGFAGGSLGARAGLGQGNAAASAGLGGVLNGNGYSGGSIGAQSTVGKNVETRIAQSEPSLASKTIETRVYQSIPTVTKTVHAQTIGSLEPQFHVEKRIKTKITPKKQKTRISTVVRTDSRPRFGSGLVVEKSLYPLSSVNVQKTISTQSFPAQRTYYSNGYDGYNAVPYDPGFSAGIGGLASIYGGGFADVGANYARFGEAAANHASAVQSGADYGNGAFYYHF